ncbi:MAG: ABC transporter permease [Deinococcales bacterium]|nr:ABC transporter permease [Deinococcales bacterium]
MAFDSAPATGLARLWRGAAARRFRRNRAAVVGLVLVLLLVLVAAFAPLLAPYAPDAQNLRARLRPPSAEHWFGTDEFGRDILSRVIFGARISLFTGLVPVFAASVVGTLVGLVAGFYRGRVDAVLMRLMDVLLAFPSLLLALAVVGALGPGLRNAVIAVAVVGVPGYARIVRSVVIAAREEEYVQAARALGAGDGRLLLRELLPAAFGALSVQATLGIGFAILSMAGLSFLGLGVQPPTSDWGEMLSRGRRFLPDSGWLLLYPGAAISLTVLAFNLLGDGLRDALDPRG